MNEYTKLISNYIEQKFSPLNTIILSKFKLPLIKNKYFSIIYHNLEFQSIIGYALSMNLKVIILTDEPLNLQKIFVKKPSISSKSEIFIFYLNLNSVSFFEVLNSLNANGSFSFSNLNVLKFNSEIEKIPNANIKLINLIELKNFEEFKVKTVLKDNINISPLSLIEFYHKNIVLIGNLCNKLSRSNLRKITQYKEPSFLRLKSGYNNENSPSILNNTSKKKVRYEFLRNNPLEKYNVK